MDLITTKQCTLITITDVRVYRGTDYESDNYLITAKI